MAFTDKSLRALAPRSAPYKIWERASDPGFCVQVTPAGGKTFLLQYRLGGSAPRFHKLGRYPALSIDQARAEARRIRALIDSGVDPRAAEKAAVESLLETPPPPRGTVRQLIEHYAQHMRARECNTADAVAVALANAVLPVLGEDTPANMVTPQDIRRVLHPIIERGARGQANRVRSYLHTAFKLGIHHDNDPANLNAQVLFDISNNPVQDVPRNPSAERVGERALSWDEIRLMWSLLDTQMKPPIRRRWVHKGVRKRTRQMSPRMQLGVKLILATGGQRSGEILSMHTDQIDIENGVWEMPPGITKNKRFHLVPLGRLSTALIKEVWALNGNAPGLLFPGKGSGRVQSGSLSEAVQEWGRSVRLEAFTPRDLRRTAKTRMGELGIEKQTRDRLQNHAQVDVSSKHYDRYDYMAEKRSAMNVWDAYLIKLLGVSQI